MLQNIIKRLKKTSQHTPRTSAQPNNFSADIYAPLFSYAKPVDYVSGACTLVNKFVFEDYDGLDGERRTVSDCHAAIRFKNGDFICSTMPASVTARIVELAANSTQSVQFCLGRSMALMKVNVTAYCCINCLIVMCLNK